MRLRAIFLDLYVCVVKDIAMSFRRLTSIYLFIRGRKKIILKKTLKKKRLKRS